MHLYVHKFCQVCNQSLTNVYVCIQIHIDIYIHVSLWGHNLGTFYAKKYNNNTIYTNR